MKMVTYGAEFYVEMVEKTRMKGNIPDVGWNWAGLGGGIGGSALRINS